MQFHETDDAIDSPGIIFHSTKRNLWLLLRRTVALLEKCKLPTTPEKGMTPQVFMDIMAVDKKVKDGKLRLILLQGPLGGCVVTGDFDPAALEATLEQFCS